MEEVIEFAPHFHTLTETGKSHFTRVADGLAELIDNSIQACSGSSRREVKVYLALNCDLFRDGDADEFSNSFVAVLDNGVGMDKDGIQKFATYSLDQKSRNQEARKDDKSFISKFGVGVKQAGFFLGDSIRVMTKTAEYSKVRDFTLDIEGLQQRADRNENVYSGVIRSRECSSLSLGSDSSNVNQLIAAINAHEATYSHFTTVLIRLHKSTEFKLMQGQRYKGIPYEIAEIYHFHLNPEDNPVNILRKFSNIKEQRQFRGIKRQTESQLVLPLTIFVGNTVKFEKDLSTIENPIKKSVNSACNMFRFKMELPDPDTNIENFSTYTQSSQVAQAATKMITVEGLIFYYACSNGNETKPSSLYRESSDENATAADEEDAANTSKLDTSIFRVFWQDRLVPESTVSSLPFFKNVQNKSALAAKGENLSDKWHSRIRGYLFFDWNFTQISNNKLKIQVDPSLNDWVNSKAIAKNTTYYPKDTKKQFTDWLIENHNKFDEEFVLTSRINISATNNNNQYEPHKTYFSVLNYAGEKRILMAGSYVKIKQKPSNSSQSSSAASASATVIAEVVDFEVRGSLNIEQAVYSGICQIRYRRLPVELFGNTIHSVAATSISFDDNDSFDVRQSEIDALLKKKAHKVEIFLFPSVDVESPTLISNNSSFIVGREYYKIGAQIRDRDGGFVTTSMSNAKQRLKVGLVLQDQKDRSTVVDCNRTSNLHEIKNGKDNPHTSSKNVENSFYSFYNISIKKGGQYFYVVTVYDGEAAILEETISIEASTSSLTAVKDVEIDISDAIFRIDDPTPPITLTLYDNFHNIVSYDGEFKLKATNPFFLIGFRRSLSYIFSGGVKQIASQEWAFNPKSSAAVLSAEKAKDFVAFDFSFQVLLPTSSGTFEAVSKVVKFKISPGRPHSFTCLTSDIRVKNGESIPFIRLACIDKFGNRTAPTDAEIWTLRAGQGPLSDFINSRGVEVEATGEVLLSNIPVQIKDVPIGGREIHQSFDLQVQGESTFNLLKLTIVILPNMEVSGLKLLFRGEEIIGPLKAEIGSELNGISIQLIDSEGLPIVDELSDEPLDIEAWISLANASKKTKNGQRFTSMDIPSIHIPREVGDHTFIVKVIAFGKQLMTELEVNAVGGQATRWRILLSKDIADGIMSGESKDIRRKIKGICLVDNQDNFVNFDSTIHSPPLLYAKQLAQKDDEEDESERMEVDEDSNPTSLKRSREISESSGGPPEEDQRRLKFMANNSALSLEPAEIVIDKTFSGEFGGKNGHKSQRVFGFVLSEGVTLTSNPSFPFPFPPAIIRVCDEESRFEDSSETLKLIPGLPRKIFLSSAEMKLDAAAVHELEVAKFLKITDLKIELMDSFGCPSSVKNVQKLTVSISDRNGKVHYSKSNVKSNTINNGKVDFDDVDEVAPIFSPTQMSQVDSNAFVYSCEGSYTFASEFVALAPAYLYCTLKKFNNVTDLVIFDLTVPPFEDSETVRVSILAGEKVCRTCEESLPKLLICSVTDNEEKFIIQEAIVTITWNESPTERISKGKKHPKTKSPAANKSRLNIEDFYSIEVDEFLGGLKLVPMAPEIGDSLALGSYTITIIFEETRAEFALLPQHKKVSSKNFILEVVHGEARELRPDDKTAAILDQLVLSTFKLSDRPSYQIGENLKFFLIDRYKNVCGLQDEKSFTFSCTICETQADSAAVRVPYLAGAEDGFVYGEISDNGLIFPSLSLADKGDGEEDFSDGVYDLKVTFARIDNSHNAATDSLASLSWTSSFTFTSSFSIAQALEAQKALLQPLVDSRQRYVKMMHERVENEIRINGIVDSPRVSSEVKDIMHSKESLAVKMEELELYFNRREKDIQQRNLRSSQLRVAKKVPGVPNPRVVAGKPFIGLVVDLGFVDDPDEAMVLSWAASNSLDALIVEDSQMSNELYNHGVKTWALDQIIPFKVRDRNDRRDRSRNAEEMSKKQLPLEEPYVLDDRSSRVRPSGNPRLMVNMIQLDQDFEHLRDTVFYSIYGKALLFDSLDDAAEYRKYLVQQRIPPPMMYSISGERFTSQGILDPRQGKMPKELPFIYGEQNPARSSDYSFLVKELEIVGDLNELLRELERIDNDLKKVNFTQLEEKIRDIRRQKLVRGLNICLSQPHNTQL